jgi:hypothetical protein
VVLLLPIAELSLGDYIRGRPAGGFPPAAEQTVCDGAADIASALAYLHRSGKADGSGAVVHNDVKPENIFQLDGKWLLGDLGLAAPPGNNGAYGRLGSLSYLAPEYLADPAAGKHPPGDVWALGVTLHRWLSGQFPFPGDTPSQRAGAVRAGTGPLLKIGNPGVRELVSDMLARSPGDRPGMVAVERRLRGAAGLRSRGATSVRRARAGGPGHLRTRLAAVAGGAALLLAGAAGGAIGYANMAPKTPATTTLRFASYGTAKSLTPGHPVPVHAQPRIRARIVGTLSDGAPAGIVCTSRGDVVHGNWGATSLWDRVNYGRTFGWVSDGLLYTGTNAAVAPACHGE